MEASGLRRHARPGYALALAAGLLACAIFASRAGPGFFSAAPLYQDNYPKYFYTADVAARGLRATGAFWAYDPTFAAGLLLNPGASTIAYPLLALIGAVTGLSSALTLKIILATFFICFPWLTFASCRRLGLSPLSSAAVMLVNVIMNFYSLRYASLHASMGMFFSGVPVLFFAQTFLIPRENARVDPRRAMAWAAAFGILLTWWHVELGLLFCLVVAHHLVLHRAAYARLSSLAYVVAAAAAVAGMCSPWLVPFIEFYISCRPYMVEAMRMVGVPWMGAERWSLFLQFVLQPAMFFTIILRALTRRETKRMRQAAALTSFSLVILALSLLLNTHLIGTGIFPTRFLDLLPLTMLAASGFAADRWLAAGRRRALVVAGVCAAVSLAGMITLATALGATEPFRNTPPDGYRKLADWIAANTTNEARVAVEASAVGGGQPLGFDPVPLLAMDVPRQYVAVPSVESAHIFYQAYLQDGRIGAHRIAEMDADALSRLLDAYNIGWVLTVSPDTRDVLSAKPEQFARIASIESYDAFAVRRERSWFLAGSGRVDASLNRLALTDLSPAPDGSVLLAYHCYESLALVGQGILECAANPLDGVGFIRIRDPGIEVLIVNDPARGFPGLPPGYRLRP